MKNLKTMKNLKIIIVALVLVLLGFAICKFMDSRREIVKIQCHGNGTF